MLYTDVISQTHTKESATVSNQVVYIEAAVGELPEWYNEDEHDMALESEIEKHFHRNPAFAGAQIRTFYTYNGANTVTGYDDDGNKVFERECDLDEAFELVYQAEVAPYA